jgi:hypothetical protein
MLTLVTATLSALAQYTPVEELFYSIENNEVTITGADLNITSLNIPPTIEGFPVTRIADVAFDYTHGNLTSVVLPASVTHIGNAAFLSTNLQTIEMPGVTHIGHSALSDCDSLTSVTLPASLISIGDSAFTGCSSLTSIPVDPQNPNYASLDGVLFNKAITELLSYPIGNPATTYTIPQGVEIISIRAFESTSLSSITFPDSLISIGDATFLNSKFLTSITLPTSLTSIDDSAFAQCDSLTSVTFLGNAPTLYSFVFSFTPATIYIYEGATGFGSTFDGLPVVVLSPGTPLPIDSITLENGNLLVKPTNGTDGITVEQTSDLIDGTWTPVTPTIVDGCFQLPASGTADFYRLSH